MTDKDLTAPGAVERLGNWIAHNASPTGIDLWNDAYAALPAALEAEKARADAAEAERDALKAEMAEAVGVLQNTMGYLDTPIGRRRMGIDANADWLSNARALLARHQKETGA